MTNPFTKRINHAKRLLGELLLEAAGDDPAFTQEQQDFLEKRFYEIRCALDGE